MNKIQMIEKTKQKQTKQKRIIWAIIAHIHVTYVLHLTVRHIIMQ